MVSEDGKGSNLWFNSRWWFPSALGAGMLLVWPASQIISQATTGSPVRRYGRMIVAAMEETTFATATH